MRNYFNELIYKHRKNLIPIVSIALIIGVFIGRFISKYELSFLWTIISLVVLNIFILISYLYIKDYDEFIKNKIIKPIYFGINIISFQIIFYLNYPIVKNSFKDIKLEFIPIDFYIIIVLNISFILFILIIYAVMFSNLKRTKITTSGIELEVDDTLLSEKQNKFLNDIQIRVENTMKVNGEMEKIVAQFITEEFLDELGDVKESYTYSNMFDYLRKIARETFGIENSNIVTDFKSINNLKDIKREYKLPNNLYNEILSKITTTTDDVNDIFVERNLVFVNYRLTSIEDDQLRKNRVIAIIEVSDSKEGFSGYGSLLMMSLKMFDIILALNTSYIYGGGDNSGC